MNLLYPPNALLWWIAIVVGGGLFLWSAVTAPWRSLWADNKRQHVYYAGIIALSVLWLPKVTVWNAIELHPLLITVFTMIVGWRLTLVAGVAILALREIFSVGIQQLFSGDTSLSLSALFRTLPVDYVWNVVIPATWTMVCLAVVNRWYFKNPFTYFWGVGFFGAMLTPSVIGASAWLLTWSTGNYVPEAALAEHFSIFYLMSFPEGFINGIVATIMTVFYPDLVRTYRDDLYTS